MPDTTSRWELPFPEDADDPDVPADVQALAESLDGVAMDDQGTLASRPVSTPGSPGKFGRYYLVTDEGTLYRDNGTGWDAVGGAALVPAGTLLPTARASAPSGFLLCDGSAVSRSTYDDLFDAIGTAYGVGDGSTTFNVPDLRGRVPVGKGTHADVDNLGESDGVAVGSRTPKHTHTNPQTGVPNQTFQTDANAGSGVAVAASGHSHAQSATGSSGPSFVAVNYLIKA